MLAGPVVGVVQTDAPDGLGMVVGVGGIIGIVVTGGNGRRSVGDELVALGDALFVLTHIKVHACEKGRCSIQGDIYLFSVLDTLRLAVCQILLGFDEVGHDCVIDLTHSGAPGNGVVQAGAKDYAGVVPALHIRHCEERYHLEVGDGAEEVVLSQKVIAQRGFSGLDGLDVGIGCVDDLIGDPPGVVDVLLGGILVVHVSQGERVFRLTGNRYVVAPELGDLEVVADIVVSAFTAALAFIGDPVFEQGVDAVGGIYCR